MTNFYRKMIEPILDCNPDDLDEYVKRIEMNPMTDVHPKIEFKVIEVLKRVVRIHRFAEYIFSNALKEELEEYDKEN